LLSRLLALWGLVESTLAALQPPAALMARIYVAQVFFMSGLTKLRDWDTTLALFADEYHCFPRPWRLPWAQPVNWCCRCYWYLVWVGGLLHWA
jgi:uncharacterized membrane protein YphA (DoxX/SURF4 family)